MVALDKVLDECNDDLDAALPLFSARQVKEGLALWSLLQLMTKNKLVSLLFAWASATRPFIQRVFKRWPHTISAALFQTMKPYSEVARENGVWVTLASLGKKSILPMTNKFK